MEEPAKMESSSTHVPVLTATQELIVKQVSIQQMTNTCLGKNPAYIFSNSIGAAIVHTSYITA